MQILLFHFGASILATNHHHVLSTCDIVLFASSSKIRRAFPAALKSSVKQCLKTAQIPMQTPGIIRQRMVEQEQEKEQEQQRQQQIQ